VKYAFIREHAAIFPVQWMCDKLGVSDSGYYDALERPESVTARCHRELGDKIEAIHAARRGRYGSPRIHAELRDAGETCCVNTVAKVMKSLGIQAISHRKFRVSTTDSNHAFPVADNVLNRDFTATKPNEVWLADMSYIPTGEGFLYLSIVEDLFSRRVVGWSMTESMESRSVVDALGMALAARCPEAGLMAHSDRGSQYASEHYQQELAKHGIRCSMSRRGNCWDNAPMESFFATLKKELVHHEKYATRAEAKSSLFEYIEVFYNRERRHSALGYVAPAQFEDDEYS
jgi:putative transposase